MVSVHFPATEIHRMSPRLLAALGGLLLACVFVCGCAGSLQRRTFLADPAHRRADDLAGRPVRGRAGNPLRPEGEQGPERFVAVVCGRQDPACADHAPGQRFGAAVQSGRTFACLRQPAGGRHRPSAVPVAARRWRATAPDERPDRCGAAQVVSRWPPDRLPEPRLARPRHDGQAGRAAEGARRVEEHCAGLGCRSGLLLGYLARRSTTARVQRWPRRRRARQPDRGHRPATDAHGRASRGVAVRPVAGRQGTGLCRRLGSGRECAEPRCVHRPGRCELGRESQCWQRSERHGAAVQPGWSLARVRTATDQGLLRGPAPADARGPPRRFGTPVDPGSLGSLCRGPGLGAGLEAPVRRDRRRRLGAGLRDSTRRSAAAHHRRGNILQPCRRCAQWHAGGLAPDLRRAADDRAHRSEARRSRETQHPQRCAARGHRHGFLRERHVRRRERQVDPDVGQLSSGLRPHRRSTRCSC